MVMFGDPEACEVLFHSELYHPMTGDNDEDRCQVRRHWNLGSDVTVVPLISSSHSDAIHCFTY